MKKIFAAVLLLLCMLLAACSQQPPRALIRNDSENEEESSLRISAEPEDTALLQIPSTLYFRYAGTSLLRQESRQIETLPNVSREKALVEALLEGSAEPGRSLLFPEKTRVISTQTQGNVLYVTFSEDLYGSYADDGISIEDAILRRRLALAALAATLTENGDFREIQVLVRAEENVGSSMRLTDRFLLEDGSRVLPPLTRDQKYLPSPSACAGRMLAGWARRDTEEMAAFFLSGTRSVPSSLPVLLSWTVYEGTLSPDGSTALVCADLMLRDPAGAELELNACPLRMIREDGVWKTDAEQMKLLLGDYYE